MELDELKQPWQQSAENIKPSTTNIMELIQNKNYGPVAQLKHRFRKQTVLILIVACIVTMNLSRHHDVFSDALFWFYIVFCIAIAGYFYCNYRLVSRMQYMDDMVKSNLEQQVHLLETGLKWRLIITRVLFVVFLIFMEVLLYFHQEPSLVKWYAQPLLVRLSAYTALTVAFYFLTKYVFRYKYGRHIEYLKKLVQQMQ